MQRIEGTAARDLQLRLHEVDAGHELRHGMLDLDAPVQLQEVEVVSVEHELRRARVLVADRAREPDCRAAHRFAQVRVDRRRRRLLEHLLVSALHRTVALAERDDVAARAEQLDLDVARTLDVVLAEHAVVAERRLRLAARRLECIAELLTRADDPHAAPAAARGGLDDEREADLVRLAARHHRHSRLARDPLRLELVHAGAQRVRRRSDPRELRCADRLCEVRVLREEPVSRVNRVGAGPPGGADVLLGEEVARDLDGLVGRAGVQRALVVRSDDGNRCDPELAARTKDA